MALTTQPLPLQAAYLVGGGAFPIWHGVEKAAQTYKRGALLQDDDAGRLTPSASPVDGSAVTKRAFGLALNDAKGTTGEDVPFVPVAEAQVYEGTLSDSTAGTHTLAQADQWQTFPITKATTHWYLDANAVSDTGGGLVVGFKDAIGKVDGRVYFIITTPARGGANAGSANM